MIRLKVEDSRDTVIINDHRLDLEQPIFDIEDDIIILGSVVVILMSGDGYADDDPNIGRNIVCVDAEAQMKWRIVPSGSRVESTFSSIEIAEPYSGIFIDEKRGVLCAYVPMGFCVDVDPDTGKISNPQQRLFG